eukprot:366222-Chlamydomonas_euryale.AAC.16
MPAGELYHDVDKRFFKYLGNGELLYANLWSLLNPVGAVWSRIMNANKKVWGGGSCGACGRWTADPVRGGGGHEADEVDTLQS